MTEAENMTNEAPVERFYETSKVLNSAETSDGKTVGILLEGEKSVNIPKWEAELLLTTTPVEAVDARNVRANYVAGKLLEVLRDLDVKISEVGVYLRKVNESFFDDNLGSIHAFMDKVITKQTGGFANGQAELRTGLVDAILKADLTEKETSA